MRVARVALALSVLLVALGLAAPATADHPIGYRYGGAEVTRWFNDHRNPNITLEQGRVVAHFFNGVVEARLRRWFNAIAASSCRPGNPAGCQSLIMATAPRYGVSGYAAVSVARCESGLNPSASNGGRYLGLFQQSATYWPGRAATYGYGGRSAFDPVANVNVSLAMVRDTGGWGHWQCKP